MRRGTRVGIYREYFLVTKRIKGLQDVQKIKLRQVKKVDLACGQRGMLEITGRTVVFAQDIFFSVEEINEEGCEQENKKKDEIEKLYLFRTHIEYSV